MASRIFNVSYHDSSVDRAVNAICGAPFGLWKRLTLGGTGSARFRLLNAPVDLLPRGMRDEDLGSFSLEARQGGVLLRFRDHLETIAIAYGRAEFLPLDLSPVPGSPRHLRMTLALADGGRWEFRVERSQAPVLQRLLALACGRQEA